MSQIFASGAAASGLELYTAETPPSGDWVTLAKVQNVLTNYSIAMSLLSGPLYTVRIPVDSQNLGNVPDLAEQNVLLNYNGTIVRKAKPQNPFLKNLQWYHLNGSVGTPGGDYMVGGLHRIHLPFFNDINNFIQHGTDENSELVRFLEKYSMRRRFNDDGEIVNYNTHAVKCNFHICLSCRQFNASSSIGGYDFRLRTTTYPTSTASVSSAIPSTSDSNQDCFQFHRVRHDDGIQVTITHERTYGLLPDNQLATMGGFQFALTKGYGGVNTYLSVYEYSYIDINIELIHNDLTIDQLSDLQFD